MKRRVESLLARSTSEDGPTSVSITPRKELQVARRMSGVVATPRYSQITAARKAVGYVVEFSRSCKQALITHRM